MGSWSVQIRHATVKFKNEAAGPGSHWRTTLKTKKSARKPAKKPAAKKAVSKKPIAKKTAAKKPPAKKAAPAKKPAAKRPPAKRPIAKKTAPAQKPAQKKEPVPHSVLLSRILQSLDDNKAEDIVTIDLEGRSSLCDAIVVATGTSSRHVSSMAEHLARRLKETGYGTRPINGLSQGDWVLVDAGEVIVHLFRSEVRAYYDLEGMWSVEEPARPRARAGVAH